jgi:2-oxoglutarate ferredoxin oxidoreductase subunit alpha
MAFEAARLSIEHMTPVMLLTDGYIANGTEPWKLPDLANYEKIKTKLVDGNKGADEKYLPYKRDDQLVRTWAIPGTPGYEHRIGGLEKAEDTGNVSYDPNNHEKMVHIRQEKINRVANDIPDQEVVGDKTGDLLVISWGGTFGATYSAVNEVRKSGKKVSLAHIRYINPMPKNLGEIIKGFKKVLVCELNLGQMKDVINARYNCNASGYNKVQGLPFKISELVSVINKELETTKLQ